jgi:hypothetical protein
MRYEGEFVDGAAELELVDPVPVALDEVGGHGGEATSGRRGRNREIPSTDRTFEDRDWVDFPR